MNRFCKLSQVLKTVGTVVLIGSSVMTSIATAGPREQAKRMYDRLNGVPPTEATIVSMAAKISSGNGVGAAQEAISTGAKYFYSTTVKNMVTPWTNADGNVHAPLNDMSATIIGMIRDNTDFRQVLQADTIYVGNTADADGNAYSIADNAHYAALENNNIDLSVPGNLASALQSATTGMPANAVAGVMTTRAFGDSFIKGGTNRRALWFTGLNFMCKDIVDLLDVTGTPDRIRQDVTRSPGGDSSIYLNSCMGCHTGLDPLTGAFAYYEFDETAEDAADFQFIFTPGEVSGKNLINANAFRYGFVTQNDYWINYWREGPNSNLGWDTNLPGEGNGIQSLGQELANSEAFASCQVQQVFKHLCFRTPSSTDVPEIDRITGAFKSSGYKMQTVFAEVANVCKGQ